MSATASWRLWTLSQPTSNWMQLSIRPCPAARRPARAAAPVLSLLPCRHPAPPAGALSWLHYLSVFYYAFEAMITNELNGQLYDFQVRWGCSDQWGGCSCPLPLSGLHLRRACHAPDGAGVHAWPLPTRPPGALHPSLGCRRQAAPPSQTCPAKRTSRPWVSCCCCAPLEKPHPCCRLVELHGTWHRMLRLPAQGTKPQAPPEASPVRTHHSA